MTLSKTLHPDDYELWPEIGWAGIVGVGLPGIYQHPHRAWEYGLALATIGTNRFSVLDVGGGGSIFAPLVAIYGCAVHQVDPQNVHDIIFQQKVATEKLITFDQADFMRWDGGLYDAVVCISVLEHVHDDTAFFLKLTRHVRPGGVLFVSVDFSRGGKALSGWHLRTYTEETLTTLAGRSDMDWIDGYDYTWHGNQVHNWTFASMALEKPYAT